VQESFGENESLVKASLCKLTGSRSQAQVLSVCVLCGSPVWPSPPVVGPLCGPPLCVGPLFGSPVWVPCVGPLCVGPLCGSPVWVPRSARCVMWDLLA